MYMEGWKIRLCGMNIIKSIRKTKNGMLLINAIDGTGNAETLVNTLKSTFDKDKIRKAGKYTKRKATVLEGLDILATQETILKAIKEKVKNGRIYGAIGAEEKVINMLEELKRNKKVGLTEARIVKKRKKKGVINVGI
ncbi:hypothetical protein WA026_005358 [Henosepilachna vigintioctopunctata]|uniref:Uncharacterized protein n=1 Tax=Henosepilachna vigintioctopunctata TaxID=420089 RepID=A0AAW1U564_9CUCU